MTYTFLHIHPLDPYIRKFARDFSHSHHDCFIDPISFIHSRHLCQPFLDFTLGCTSSILHRALHPNRFQSTHNGVLGRRFKALPYHSTYQFISSTNLTLRSLISACFCPCSHMGLYAGTCRTIMDKSYFFAWNSSINKLFLYIVIKIKCTIAMRC